MTSGPNAATAIDQRIELKGPWQVWSTPLAVRQPPPAPPSDERLSVPACAHLQPTLFPENPYWGGHLRALNDRAWWYARTFSAASEGFRRARLLCEGIDYHAEVWLNGQHIGAHEGYATAFSLDVTAALRRGGLNHLLIRVSSPWDPPTTSGAYPIDHVLRGLVKGLYEHGEGVIPPDVNPIGIWRPMWLLLDDGLSIDRLHVRAGADGNITCSLIVTNATGAAWRGTLDLNVTADNHDGPGAALARPLDLPPGEHHLQESIGIPEPRPWWPWDHGAPNLYRLRATLRMPDGRATTEAATTLGLRDVRLERRRERFTYRINGRPVFIRGTSYIPGLYLAECTPDHLASDVALARAANLNLIRVHVHVSPAELYDLCDRAGMLIWQDFDLNWVHDTSEAFERRARSVQRAVIDQRFNHPSIITWSCHNEPTMVFLRRENLEQRPDPQLYADACAQDPTRPVFLCSGQMDSDWRRSGDSHFYYGALWSRRYTDVYRRKDVRLCTEFGFEAPAAPESLRAHPEVWARLGHLEGQIERLWAYQAALTQFYIEHLRRLRATSCGGYIHFWLADLAPQVGCGALDSERREKGGYMALQRASQPLQVALEHDGRRPLALWVFNDTPVGYPDVRLRWTIRNSAGQTLHEGSLTCTVAANTSQRMATVRWPVKPGECARIELVLNTADGTALVSNAYNDPFRPLQRPRGYPWRFDPVLGCKVFDRPGAPSLANVGVRGLARLVPPRLREILAEWALRQQLPPRLLSLISRVARRLSP